MSALSSYFTRNPWKAVVMNARLALAFFLSIGTATTGVAGVDVVVLTNGERLDVESYEVKGQMVVVETWDGRLRSLPQAYVDLAATEEANRGKTLEQRIAPERLATARTACDAYGMRSRVGDYWEAFESELRKLRGQMSYPAYEQLRASFRNAFDDDRSVNAVVAHFARNANLGLLDSWSAWLHEPSTKRMIALETTDLNPQAVSAATRFYVKLKSDTATYERRRALVDRLDEARETTEGSVEIVMALLEAFAELGKSLFPGEDFDYDREELRAALAPALRETVRIGFLVAFKDVSDADLETYIDYWRSKEGQLVAGLLNGALESGAQRGSEIAMEMVAGKRHAVP